MKHISNVGKGAIILALLPWGRHRIPVIASCFLCVGGVMHRVLFHRDDVLEECTGGHRFCGWFQIIGEIGPISTIGKMIPLTVRIGLRNDFKLQADLICIGLPLF